jgi:thiamine phosphate synthase YjbQ (UPF0047 family)
MSMIKIQYCFSSKYTISTDIQKKICEQLNISNGCSLATVAMLSAAVVVVRIEQASAQDTIFIFKQKTVKHMQWSYNL